MNHHLERLVILIRALLHPHHHVAIHLHEPAITIPRKPIVLRRRRQRLHGLVIQPQVQNRIHHPRHRIPRPGPHRDQQRHRFLIPELRAHDLLDERNPGLDGGLERFGIRLLVLVVVGADFRRDREARRHRQANAAHLCQVCAFTAQQRFHAAVAVSLLVSKQVYVFCCFRHKVSALISTNVQFTRFRRKSSSETMRGKYQNPPSCQAQPPSDFRAPTPPEPAPKTPLSSRLCQPTARFIPRPIPPARRDPPLTRRNRPPPGVPGHNAANIAASRHATRKRPALFPHIGA